METKQVLLVDAFADEPMAGLPVTVVPGDVSRRQLRAIAGELGTSGAVTLREGNLVYVDRDGSIAFVEAAVAGGVGLIEHASLEVGSHTIAVDSDGDGDEYRLEIGSDRAVRVDVPPQEVSDVEVAVDRIGNTLGIDSAALQDVGADLPVGRIDAFGGTVLVPVNFLEHLGNVDPDEGGLDTLLEETGATRLCAFTFDTLGRGTDLHVRVFDPVVDGLERPTAGVVAGGCGRYLSRHGAFDGERQRIRIECGHFLDRPATVETTTETRPRVGGTALTVLDGTLTVPEDGSDDIIEA